jgi:hypothetical protein
MPHILIYILLPKRDDRVTRIKAAISKLLFLLIKIYLYNSRELNSY